MPSKRTKRVRQERAKTLKPKSTESATHTDVGSMVSEAVVSKKITPEGMTTLHPDSPTEWNSWDQIVEGSSPWNSPQLNCADVALGQAPIPGPFALETGELDSPELTASLPDPEEEDNEQNFIEYTLVDTREGMDAFLESINKCDDEEIELFIDAEGGNGHGRDYTLNTLQFRLKTQKIDWLVDTKTLGKVAFDTPCATGNGRTLREILEDPKVKKAFFDTRADADSLFGNYQVHLRGIIDLQLMELVVRATPVTYRQGLDSCISMLPCRLLPWDDRIKWDHLKRMGKNRCKALGYGTFDLRPLPKVLQRYAVNDSRLMPLLFQYLYEDCGLKDNKEKWDKVLRLSEQAVENTISPDYIGNSKKAAEAPEELQWEWNNDSDSESEDDSDSGLEDLILQSEPVNPKKLYSEAHL